MDAFDNIFGLKKKQSKINIDFPCMFPKQRNIKPLINMPQGRYLKKTNGMNSNRFNDYDGDRVINGMDCFPFDKKRHNSKGVFYDDGRETGKVRTSPHGSKNLINFLKDRKENTLLESGRARTFDRQEMLREQAKRLDTEIKYYESRKAKKEYPEEYHETSAWEDEQNRQSDISDENERYRKEYANPKDEYG